MPNPAELPLQWYVFGRVNVSSSMTGFDMNDLVPPPGAKDAFETAHFGRPPEPLCDDMGFMSRNHTGG